MKLWLARHARTLAPEGTCYGAMDVAADAQATALAARALAAALPAGLVVRSSPRARCVQLADALHALRPDLPHRSDARLAEMDFGTWEGRRWDAIGRAAMDRWLADFAAHRCGGGESVAHLVERVSAALQAARAEGRDTLWITHAGVVRAVRLLAGGAGVPRSASDWPLEGLAFGAWDCIGLGKTP
jgi:alpha-ribazole phosphatase